MFSFGLSDLHGDGRVHEVSGNDLPSGFGFELTFRLKREVGETSPPTWPAALMQALAKYVFQSGECQKRIVLVFLLNFEFLCVSLLDIFFFSSREYIVFRRSRVMA